VLETEQVLEVIRRILRQRGGALHAVRRATGNGLRRLQAVPVRAATDRSMTGGRFTPNDENGLLSHTASTEPRT
jgi:hypothetical protein